METVKFELTEQELDDIRHLVIAKVLDGSDGDPEKAFRLDALSKKLARISVLGHA